MWFAIAGLAVPLLILLVLYNTLVARKNAVENALAGVEVQLKKRYDLVPNLVAAVSGYMAHEKETLSTLVELRTKALSGSLSADEKLDVDDRIAKTLRGVMVSVEAYPELKASDHFVQLQRSLNEVEEQLSAARRFYNAAATDYNNAREMLPTNILAAAMGYERRKLFEAEAAARENVDVAKLLGR